MKRILWAEDKDREFETLSKVLQVELRQKQIPCEIVRAKDGDEVFFHLEGDGQSFDLLVVDLEMPKWNGIVTIQRLIRHWAHLPKIVISSRTTEPANASVLAELQARGIIQSFHSVTAIEDWRSAIVSALSFIEPKILHISDLHFGQAHAFGKRLSAEDLVKLFLGELEQSRRPNLLVISGDIANHGEEVEFARGRQFIEMLMQYLSIEVDRLVLCPGNHDVFQRESESARLNHYVEFLNEIYGSDPLRSDMRRLFPKMPVWADGRLRTGRADVKEDLFAIQVCSSSKIVFIAMNSTVLVDGEFQFGEIKERQLLAMNDALRNLPESQRDFLRVAVFHHHLFPVPSFMTDGDPGKSRSETNTDSEVSHSPENSTRVARTYTLHGRL